jgi:hypothetical protein
VRQSVYICGIWEDGLTNGWVCGVAEKNSDWLGSQNWAPHQGSVGGNAHPVVQQGFDLLWVQVTTSAECKKVSDTPYSGKELRTQQERSPSKL